MLLVKPELFKVAFNITVDEAVANVTSLDWIDICDVTPIIALGVAEKAPPP